MSNAIAKNATDLTPSTPKDGPSILSLVRKNAIRSVKGATRERLLLNTSKLVSHVCEEWRSHRALEKGAQLPKEIVAEIHDTVIKFVEEQCSRINPTNVLSFREYSKHDFRNMRIVRRLQTLGENMIALKDQHVECTILITEKQHALNRLMQKPTPDFDRELAVKEEISKLELTLKHIEASMAALEKKQ